MNQIFTKYTTATAKLESQPMLESTVQNYGFLPNVFAFMAESPVTLKSYVAVEENLKSSHFSNDELHIAMLVVSINNGCKFCTSAHRLMALGAGVSNEELDSIYNNCVSESSKYEVLIALINLLMNRKGQLDSHHVAAFIKAGFTKEKIIETIAIIALKTISNYSNRLCEVSLNPEITNNF